jgi:predicted lactoylglutathione lyase
MAKSAARKIFVNLPVKDLDRSITFFKALGFTLNAQFTDETAASMVISESIYATLVTYEKFNEFSNKLIADAAKTTEVVTCLSAESREEVNKMADSALKAGAQKLLEPQDYGFMYLRSFQDPDGHIWEIMWMDETHVKQ